MLRHYLTLFDAHYAVKGALMLDSLARHARDPYVVTVIALDDVVAAQPWAAPVHVVPLAALETAVPALRAARADRPWREYCWTLASVALRWRLDQLAYGEAVTYLDADIGFFGDPAACFAELGDRSIGIVPHRFAPEYRDYVASAGVYNVSWVTLRHDAVGLACAADWAGQVLARCDTETCGDQRYLDAWPARYGAELRVFVSPGIGVAPWNVFGYEIDTVVNDASGVREVTVDDHPVVFYHYHELAAGAPPCGRSLHLDEFRLTLGYPLRPVDVDVFYRDYCRRYRALAAELGC